MRKPRQERLCACRESQRSASHSAEVGAKDFCSHTHILSYGDAEDLVARNRGIVLQAGIAASDEQVLLVVDEDEPMDPKIAEAFREYDIAPFQRVRHDRSHVHRLAVKN